MNVEISGSKAIFHPALDSFVVIAFANETIKGDYGDWEADLVYPHKLEFDDKAAAEKLAGRVKDAGSIDPSKWEKPSLAENFYECLEC